MNVGPRRQRANAWIWVYIALFGSDDEDVNTRTKSTGNADESADEMSEDSEIK